VVGLRQWTQPTPHPSRFPMKCTGIAGHHLPKGEGKDPSGKYPHILPFAVCHLNFEILS
jgi:hypothetical protein